MTRPAGKHAKRMFVGLLLMFVAKIHFDKQHQADDHEWHQMAKKGKENECHIIQSKAKQLCPLKLPRWVVKPSSGMLASGFTGDGGGLLD